MTREFGRWKQLKVGLALGGGGVRGAAHIGVIRELLSIGVQPAAVAGTSSGGLVAALYAVGVDWEEVAHMIRGLTLRSVVGRRFSLRRSRPNFMAFLHERFMERTFESLALPLRICAFDPLTGQVVVFQQGPILPALYATIALPGVFAPARTEHHPLLVDAGLVSALPTHALHDVDAVIAVDVRAADPPARAPGPLRRTRWVYEQAYRALYRSNSVIDQARADIILAPDIGDVGTFDFPQSDRCIEAGRQAVQARIDQIRSLVGARA